MGVHGTLPSLSSVHYLSTKSLFSLDKGNALSSLQALVKMNTSRGNKGIKKSDLDLVERISEKYSVPFI